MGCCLSKRNITADTLPALKDVLIEIDSELKSFLKELSDTNDIKKIEQITLIETVKSKLNFLKIKIDSNGMLDQKEIRVINKLFYYYYDVKENGFPKNSTNEFINTINAYLNESNYII
jgi:hypothetical protein